MKICNKCKKEKDITEFHKSKNSPDGLTYVCKSCAKKRSIDYHNNNRDHHLQKMRENTQFDKITVFNHYSNNDIKCSCCDEKHIEFLCLDHINGGGNKQRKELNINSGREFYRWLINNNFPDGYRVLCHNCNMSIGSFGYCPHNRNGCISTELLNNKIERSNLINNIKNYFPNKTFINI